MVDFGYPEHATPGYRIKSHVHPDQLDSEKNECILLPNFRLPTHIHSRSANSKWLTEIAHRNPIWIHTKDAQKLGVKNGDLLKIETEIYGYYNFTTHTIFHAFVVHLFPFFCAFIFTWHNNYPF